MRLLGDKALEKNYDAFSASADPATFDSGLGS